MRSFRSLRSARRFALVAVTLPVVAAAVVLPTAAWAKGGSKPLKCAVLDGTDGGQWTFEGCNQLPISGASGATNQDLAVASPPSSVTITWGARVVRGEPSLQTTFSLTELQLTGGRDQCPSGGSEYVFRGLVQSNSFTPGVKGHLKWYACDQGGVIHDLGSNGRFPKPLRF